MENREDNLEISCEHPNFSLNLQLQIYADNEVLRWLGGFETYFISVYLRLILGC